MLIYSFNWSLLNYFVSFYSAKFPRKLHEEEENSQGLGRGGGGESKISPLASKSSNPKLKFLHFSIFLFFIKQISPDLLFILAWQMWSYHIYNTSVQGVIHLYQSSVKLDITIGTPFHGYLRLENRLLEMRSWPPFLKTAEMSQFTCQWFSLVSIPGEICHEFT